MGGNVAWAEPEAEEDAAGVPNLLANETKTQ
jgi:hypothetical protein